VSPESGGMHRAREELAAAGLLADHGFPAQAVSRSYYAALYMAEEALQRVGAARSSTPEWSRPWPESSSESTALIHSQAGFSDRSSNGEAALTTTSATPHLRKRPKR